MTQTPQQTSANVQTFRDVIATTVMSSAFSLEAFLHHSFGIRYIGRKGFLGFVLIAQTALFCFPHDPKRPIAYLAGVYVLFWLVHQTGNWYRRWKNKVDGHTYYTGTPHLCRLLPFLSEGTIKRLEPLLVLGAAYGVYHLNRPIGFYLIYSGLALLFTSTYVAWNERRRALDLSDAVNLQRHTAENFRAIEN